MYDGNFIIEVRNNENRVRNWIFGFLVVAGAVFFFGKDQILLNLNSFEVKLTKAGSVDSEQTQGGDINFDNFEPAVTAPQKLGNQELDKSIFTANKILVKDTESGAVLFSKDEYEYHSLASITKLMSALVLMDQGIAWNSTTTATGSGLFDTIIQKDFDYLIEDLWNAGLIASSNRSIITLVDASGLSEEQFVEKMNQKARELGMMDTVFIDPTGLAINNISTASDIILLLNEALRNDTINKTLLRNEYHLATVDGEHDRQMWNTNWLLLGWIPHGFEALQAGKTGFIPESGYNFVTKVADQFGNQIDIVILGAIDHELRFSEARDIAEWVFKNYSWQ